MWPKLRHYNITSSGTRLIFRSSVVLHIIFSAKLRGNSSNARKKCEVQRGVEILISTAFPVEIATVVIISLIEIISY